MTVTALIKLYSNIEDFYHRYIKTNEGKRALIITMVNRDQKES